MARDAVANMVDRLRDRGFEPRRVGEDAWEARCPAHRSADHALAITRNSFNQVELECRSSNHCQHSRIVGALGITNDHVYAETADWSIARLRRVPIEPSLFTGAAALEPVPVERGQAGPLPVVESATSGLPAPAECADASGLHGVEGPTTDLGGAGTWEEAGNLAVEASAAEASRMGPATRSRWWCRLSPSMSIAARRWSARARSGFCRGWRRLRGCFARRMGGFAHRCPWGSE